MITSVLEDFGKTTLRHLEYVGGLTRQVRAALVSLGQTLPLIGNRNRWRSAVRQMLAVGVDAFPMVGIMAVCTGFILAMQGRGRRVVLDLEEVKLVDRDVVNFLGLCESKGIELRHCAPYIRERIFRERVRDRG